MGMESSIIGSIKDVDVPNPNKSFTGKVMTHKPSGYQVVLLGAHFPINEIRDAICSGPNAQAMIKRFYGKILRYILKKTKSGGFLTPRTIIFLAGDLNSRTILPDGVDGLTAALEDEELRAMITRRLGVKGNWHDLSTAHDTYITYKYAM